MNQILRNLVTPASITAFAQDPEWIRIEKETEAQGPLRSGITIHRWTPTSFSPLR